MLTQLPPSRFAEVVGLYRESRCIFPLILAVLEGSQPGQVFVDDYSRGTAFVVNKFGFAKLLGADDDVFNDELATLLADQGRLGCSYLLWYDPPESWRKRLEPFVGDRVKQRTRIRFQLEIERAPYLSEAAGCDEGFALQNIDHELLPLATHFGLNLESRFWTSADEVVRKTMGVCLTYGEKMVSICYAAAVADSLAEVDVATDPEFRGRGLGTLAAQAFVRRCLAQGITPTWDCFDYNAGSTRMAASLGFVELRSYPFYSFNLGLSLGDGRTVKSD